MKNINKNIPKANYTVFGNYKNLKELRKVTENWLKENFKDKKIVNKETRFIIEFNNKSFKKLVSGNIGKIKLYSLSAIEKIIKNGKLTKVDVDNKKRKDIIAFYYFVSEVIVDDFIYDFYFTVRQLKTGKFIYSGNIDFTLKKPL